MKYVCRVDLDMLPQWTAIVTDEMDGNALLAIVDDFKDLEKHGILIPFHFVREDGFCLFKDTEEVIDRELG